MLPALSGMSPDSFRASRIRTEYVHEFRDLTWMAVLGAAGNMPALLVCHIFLRTLWSNRRASNQRTPNMSIVARRARLPRPYLLWPKRRGR